MCEIGGRVAGYAYATTHRVRAAYQWSVDTSVYVDAAWRRLGVGRGLYQSLFAMLAAQGFFNAFAGIALPNAGSVGAARSGGLRAARRLPARGVQVRGWHDVGWWQLTLRRTRRSPTRR